MEIRDIAVMPATRRSETKKVDKKLAGKTLGSSELILFTRTLGELLEGGVPILGALDGLEKAASSLGLKNMLASVKEGIQHGMGLSRALENSGTVPNFIWQTLHGGEVSGQVSMVLRELTDYMEKEQALKRSIRDALIYPAFILSVGFVTLGVLIGYVLPKLKTVYDGFGTALPLITVMILNLSKVFFPGVAAFFIAGSFFFFSPRRDERLMIFLNKAPFFGDLFKGFVRVRFSRLFSMLLESGVPVLQALEVAEKTFSNPFVKNDIFIFKESLARGQGFSSCLDRVEWMNPVSRMLIVSGEEAGRLPASFFQVARDTESDLEARIQTAVKLLEPGLILFIGASVGFVVIGTVLPIFDMSSVVR